MPVAATFPLLALFPPVKIVCSLCSLCPLCLCGEFLLISLDA
jgi:hypothetical protein